MIDLRVAGDPGGNPSLILIVPDVPLAAIFNSVAQMNESPLGYFSKIGFTYLDMLVTVSGIACAFSGNARGDRSKWRIVAFLNRLVLSNVGYLQNFSLNTKKAVWTPKKNCI
jgi:hypothetical protein